MNKTEYSIKETLQLLNISRTTLYSRFDKYKTELESHIYIKDGKKYVSTEGIHILMCTDKLGDVPNNCPNNLDNVPNNYPNNLNNNNYNEIKSLLMEQLAEKDRQLDALRSDKDKVIEMIERQLETKDEQIHTLTELHKNSQLLLGQAQQKIILLDVPKKTFWSKITNWGKKEDN